MRPGDLPATWRERSDELRPYAPAAAEAFARAADELAAAMRAADDEPLTLAEAAEESGYSARRLRELLAAGDVPNAGRKHRPRVRRGDLPRRPNKASSNGYDAAEDAARMNHVGGSGSKASPVCNALSVGRPSRLGSERRGFR
jgi:hypothetical protein